MANIGDIWMSVELQGKDLVASAKVQGKKAGEAAGAEMATGIRAKIKGIDLFKGGLVAGAGAKLAAGAIGLVSRALDTMLSKLDEAHQAFLDDEVSASNLALALKNNVPAWDGNTAAVEAYATAQARLAFTDDEVRLSIGQLIGITHDQTEAMRLNSIAQDLARAKNIDLATATDIVTKAAQGNGKALKSLGIDTAGLKTAAELLDAIQKNVAGSAENWALTNEGKLAVSNVKVQESMEKVGAIIDQVSQVVVPLVADAFVGLVGILGDFWDATEPIRTTLAPILTEVFGTIGNVMKGTFIVLTTIIDGIKEAIRLANLLATAVGPSAETQDFAAKFEAKYGRRPTPVDFAQWKGGQLPGFNQAPPVVVGPRVRGGSVTEDMPYLVGERRPEVFVPGDRGTIIPSLATAMGGWTGGDSGGQPAIIRVEAGGNLLLDYIDEGLSWRRRG